MKKNLMTARGLIATFLCLSFLFTTVTLHAQAKDKPQRKAPPRDIALAPNPEAGPYHLGPEDVIKISVWGDKELTTEMPVRPDGYISFPLVGDIKAKGLTPNELKNKIATGLKSYISSPNITVVVKEINSIRYFITGEVQSPGTYKLNRAVTLLHLFSLAGGFKEKVDLKRSYILRDGKRLNVDFFALVRREDYSQNVVLKNNDLVFIQDNFDKRINIMGEVVQPKILDFREGLTILDAVLMAEGLTEVARSSAAMIFRKAVNAQGKRVVRRINVELDKVIGDGDLSLNIPLAPGDVIHIPRSFF